MMEKTKAQNPPNNASRAKNAVHDSTPSNDEVGRSVDYLIAYRLEVIKDLLSEAGLRVSGNKSELRKRVLQALADDKLSPEKILFRLDEVEGWGNQHVVLLKSTSSAALKWQNSKQVNERLKNAKLDALLNRSRPIALPNEPTLSQIMWSASSLRLIWIHGSQWQLRVPELDYVQTGGHREKVGNVTYAEMTDGQSILYKAYQIQHKRQVCYFDWDLKTCEAALMMPRLPHEIKYDELQSKLFHDAEQVLEMSSFETLQLSRLIGNLETSNEVSRRDILLTTSKRTEINIRSADRKADAYDDPAANDARNAIKNRVVGTRGQFYWLPNGKSLDRTIHMRVYPSKQRISIHDQCTEAEVRHVLSRVRHHCR